jgi:hypothetical protein
MGNTSNQDLTVRVRQVIGTVGVELEDASNNPIGVSSNPLHVVQAGSGTITASVLPTGAATEATLSTLNAKVTTCNTGAVGGTVAVSNMIPAVETGLAKENTLSDIKDELKVINSFVPTLYDNIVLSYTGSNLTGVVFKLAAVTVSTLTLGYNGGDQLITVVKS